MRTKQTDRKAKASELPPKNVITRDTLIVDDIKHTICELLDGIKSGCSFATYGAFSEAPLPDLFLRGYGPIPLPMALRDTGNIIKEIEESRDGTGSMQLWTAESIAKDDRAGLCPQMVKCVDRGSVLDGQWEMNGGNLLMRNPSWDEFVRKIAVRAARDLGTKSDDGMVEVELVKARIWTPEASMPPYKKCVG